MTENGIIYTRSNEQLIMQIIMFIICSFVIENGDGILMCDTKKYYKIFKEIKELQPDDTLQLVMEAEDEDEREFFELVGDFLLQRKQRTVIKENLF